jgi:hypothetical protein
VKKSHDARRKAKELLEEAKQKVEKLIEEKQQLLLENYKNMYINSQQNAVLENIKEDYEKYYNYIIEEKNEQLKAFYILNTYVENLEKYKKYSKHNAEDMRHQQMNIINEINIIKQNLHDIISNNKK